MPTSAAPARPATTTRSRTATAAAPGPRHHRPHLRQRQPDRGRRHRHRRRGLGRQRRHRGHPRQRHRHRRRRHRPRQRRLQRHRRVGRPRRRASSPSRPTPTAAATATAASTTRSATATAARPTATPTVERHLRQRRAGRDRRRQDGHRGHGRRAQRRLPHRQRHRHRGRRPHGHLRSPTWSAAPPSVDGDGDVTFHPTANLCGNGAGSFDYTVDDGNGGSDTGHVVDRPRLRQRRPRRRRRRRHGRRELGGRRTTTSSPTTPTSRATTLYARVRLPVTASAPRPGTASMHGNKVQFTPAPIVPRPGRDHLHRSPTARTRSTATLTVTVGPDVDAPVVAKPTVAFGNGRVNETAPLLISWSAFDAGVGRRVVRGPGERRGRPRSSRSTPARRRPSPKLYPFRKIARVARPRDRQRGQHLGLGQLGQAQDRRHPEQQPRRSSTPGPGTASRLPRLLRPGLHLRQLTQGSHAGATFKGRVRPVRRTQDEALGLRQGLRRRRADRPLQAPQRARSSTARSSTRFSWAANGRTGSGSSTTTTGMRTNFDAFIVLK